MHFSQKMLAMFGSQCLADNFAFRSLLQEEQFKCVFPVKGTNAEEFTQLEITSFRQNLAISLLAIYCSKRMFFYNMQM